MRKDAATLAAILTEPGNAKADILSSQSLILSSEIRQTLPALWEHCRKHG
jgi:hypothetical protein